MKFSIATCYSDRYQRIAELCLPSWSKHSGAEFVDVRRHPDITGSGSFMYAVACRAEFYLETIRAAVRRKVPLLLLDSDCLILGDVSEGFPSEKPIGIGRWPNINIGVVFLRTDLDWWFVDFFEAWRDQLRAEVEGSGTVKKTADQDILGEMVKAEERDVEKLDHLIWNHTFGPGWTENPDRLAGVRDRVRIVHLLASNWHFGELKRTGASVFPEAQP